jgi:hypothetical protein
VEVDGSDQMIANLALGLTYAYANNRAFDVSMGFGLTEDAPDFSLALSVPFTFQVGNLLEWVF